MMPEKRGKGRPKFHLDDKQVEQLATMAGLGMPVEQMAAVMDMHKDTLNKLMNRDERIKSAVLKGRGKASANMRQNLYQLAMKGNVVATIFWLKCREGWKEPIEPEGDADREPKKLAYAIAAKEKK